MNAREELILFLSLWSITSALLSTSVEIFLTIELIGVLITLEIGDFYLPSETKDALKNVAYLLLLIFAFIVAKKIYSIIH